MTKKEKAIEKKLKFTKALNDPGGGEGGDMF